MTEQPRDVVPAMTADATIHLDPTLDPTDFNADETHAFHDLEGEGFALEERNALRRVSGIRTDLEDVTEVEYRQLRLERVVLMGVYPRGDDAETSLFELKALAETAGCEVLEGLVQRKDNPDPK
ncbi:MAG: GTP-binding protein, partial [Frankiales bacterium]|nr:GTP-binding protein [Frankiales bacterium]